jgi:hypothetical protein
MMSAMAVPPLVADATRRSGAVWVAMAGHPPRVVWHLWHDDALWLVCGGLEQPLPVAPTAVVTVREKVSQSDRLVAWHATVSPVVPGSEQWDEVVPLLHAQRLNAPDGEEQPARWARESTVLRLAPTGEVEPPTDDPELREPR